MNSNKNLNKIIINNGILNLSLNQRSNKTLNKHYNPSSFGSFKKFENINSNNNSSSGYSSNNNLYFGNNNVYNISGPIKEKENRDIEKKENMDLFFKENESFSQKLQENFSIENLELENRFNDVIIFNSSLTKSQIKKGNSNSDNKIYIKESSKNMFLNSNIASNYNIEFNPIQDLNTSEPIKNITFNSTFKKNSIDSEKDDYEFDFNKIEINNTNLYEKKNNFIEDSINRKKYKNDEEKNIEYSKSDLEFSLNENLKFVENVDNISKDQLFVNLHKSQICLNNEYNKTDVINLEDFMTNTKINYERNLTNKKIETHNEEIKSCK